MERCRYESEFSGIVKRDVELVGSAPLRSEASMSFSMTLIGQGKDLLRGRQEYSIDDSR